MQVNRLNQKYNLTAYRNSLQSVKRCLYNVHVAHTVCVSVDINTAKFLVKFIYLLEKIKLLKSSVVPLCYGNLLQTVIRCLYNV